MVRLPFKRDPKNIKLPGSYSIAEKMLLRMEKRFFADPILSTLYVEFMKDYEDIGHIGKTGHIIDFIFYFFFPIMAFSRKIL